MGGPANGLTVRAVTQIIEWRDKPRALRCDNGPEHVSAAMATWAAEHDIEILFIGGGAVRSPNVNNLLFYIVFVPISL